MTEPIVLSHREFVRTYRSPKPMEYAFFAFACWKGGGKDKDFWWEEYVSRRAQALNISPMRKLIKRRVKGIKNRKLK